MFLLTAGALYISTRRRLLVINLSMWNGFSQWTISKKYKKSEDPNCSLRLTPEKQRGTPWCHRLRKTGTGCPLRSRPPPPTFFRNSKWKSKFGIRKSRSKFAIRNSVCYFLCYFICLFIFEIWSFRIIIE